KKKKKEVHGTLAPDDNEEYFLYQTLLGALPFEKMQEGFKDRMREYIVKAVREAKRHTAWIKPDTAYEEACVGFFERISEDTGNNAFMQSFLPFQKKLAFYGIINSLSQTLLKLCAPGIPDFYQGTELWDLSLVDPDNRRQVDFSARKEYLSVIRQRSSLDRLGLLRDLWEKREDGRIKLFLIYQGLQLRNSHVEVFAQGEYIPLSVEGVGKDHLVVFLRKNANASVICIAPRLLSSLVPEGNPPLGEEIWKDTAIILPPESASSWKDIFSNEQIRVADGRIAVAAALRYFPVALLMDHTS
ncbi:MAG: malto-oligosyltrehalose synthase, partial [Candidatus Omnitrophica bacterium]|nr:malto-oligosyltrehalose synthase [Candidatus Omnitrophota bacterium]